MKTTELWIEQVLIGMLGIAVVLSPWLPEILGGISGVGTALGLAGGSLALGLAFWLGIPLDRLADTLTERLDRHARLRFALALARARGRPLPQPDQLGRLDRDLGPEDRLRITGLRDTDAAVSWIEYHRSRIRLTRALAFYGPALTVTLVLGLERLGSARPPVEPAWLAGIVVAYGLWALLARQGLPLPRTTEPGLIDYSKTWRFIDAEAQWVSKKEDATSDMSVWGTEWRSLVVPAALLALALARAGAGSEPRVLVAAGAGAVVTIVSAWSWWRISFTYRTYLYDLDHYGGERARR